MQWTIQLIMDDDTNTAYNNDVNYLCLRNFPTMNKKSEMFMELVTVFPLHSEWYQAQIGVS